MFSNPHVVPDQCAPLLATRRRSTERADHAARDHDRQRRIPEVVPKWLMPEEAACAGLGVPLVPFRLTPLPSVGRAIASLTTRKGRHAVFMPDAPPIMRVESVTP